MSKHKPNMIIIQRPNQTQRKELAITLGFFDGVHLGHRELIQTVTHDAEIMGLESAVLTFWPHPRLVLHKDPEKLRFLNTLNEKAKIIAKFGIDYFIVQEFAREFFNLDATDFVKLLVYEYKVKHIVIGADHRFGKGRTGDSNLLNKLSGQMGFTVKVIPSQRIEGIDVSSTKIREALLLGNLELANQMLGYPYLITGAVQSGNQLGRKIGFPTANIRPNDPLKLIPKEGVYAVVVNANHTIYKGMLNIGFRPTVGITNNQTIEVNIFDFENDLYNSSIEVALVSRLRDEKRFASVEHLKKQLVIDKQNALEVLKNEKVERFQNLFLTLRPEKNNNQ